MASKLPIVILGGSDGCPAELPSGEEGQHPLSGYKGVDLRVDGAPLVSKLRDRLQRCGAFDPVYVAGPAAIYAPVVGASSVIDADGSFGQNIRAAAEAMALRHPATPIGITTCDILPEVETLRRVMQGYFREEFVDVWFPLIRAPQDRRELGASSWKPGYRIVPQAGEAAVRVLPGHLVVVNSSVLRLNFIYRLFDLAYRTRNRTIGYRRSVVLRGILLALLYQDLLHLLALRAPTLTYTVLREGISATRRLKAGTITRDRLERSLHRILVTHRHRKRNPEHRALLPIVDAMDLARDIDTEEEARELGADVSTRSA